MNKPEYIIIHHVEHNGDVDIEEIRRWHVEDRGWSDVGYHYYIRRSGLVEKGRDENEAGAHTLGKNRKSIGVCFEGHHDHEYWTDHQWLSFDELAAKLMNKYAIPPEGILGHRECGSPKTCPGNMIDCDEVRARFILSA